MSKILSVWFGLVGGIVLSHMLVGGELLLFKLIYVSLAPIGLILGHLFIKPKSSSKPKFNSEKTFDVDLWCPNCSSTISSNFPQGTKLKRVGYEDTLFVNGDHLTCPKCGVEGLKR